MRQRSDRPRAGRGQRTLRGRFARVSLILLRAVALCLLVQMSGVIHFALDLWLDGAAAAEHFAERDEEDEGNCPPGCPSCHCVHSGSALPVPSETFAGWKLLPAYELLWVPYEAGVPPSPARSAIYRPPRA